jgi:hypothetical protein
MNGGSHPMRKAGAFVRGVLLPATAYGEELPWDVRRPQATLHCDAPGFSSLVNDLHAQDSETAVGVVRARHPDGHDLFCIAYEGRHQGLYICMDPRGESARVLLQDMEEHKSLHISFLSNSHALNNRQELDNSLVSEQLDEQGRSNYSKPVPQSHPDWPIQLQARLEVMHAMAEAMDDKPRVFVMMHDVSAEAFREVRNTVNALL